MSFSSLWGAILSFMANPEDPLDNTYKVHDLRDWARENAVEASRLFGAVAILRDDGLIKGQHLRCELTAKGLLRAEELGLVGPAQLERDKKNRRIILEMKEHSRDGGGFMIWERILAERGVAKEDYHRNCRVLEHLGFLRKRRGVDYWEITTEGSHALNSGHSLGILLQASALPLSALQTDIMEALRGKVLMKDALALVVGRAASSLYCRKTGSGLTWLLDKELVLNKAGAGYYRPDAPPSSWPEAPGP